MPILTCILFTFNWLTLTSEMHFVTFHPEVASCLLSRGKIKYAPLGMRLLWKYIRNYFLVYHLISYFLLYLQNYKEFEAEILDLQSEKYVLSFDIKKYTTSGWALGDENVIGIRAFNTFFNSTPASLLLSIAKSFSRGNTNIVLNQRQKIAGFPDDCYHTRPPPPPGLSQPHSPGWARVPLSSFFHKFQSIFLIFSSNFTYFLPHFGSPGGRWATHPPRMALATPLPPPRRGSSSSIYWTLV